MLQSGQRLDDYRIVNFFAGGGMGEIYLAEEVSLGRQVAIKVIRPEAIRYPDSADGRKVIQLFRREATAIAKLNHPYILPLYRFGEATLNSDPLMYMVMPYCQEKSLPDWMYAHGKKIFSPQEVDSILRQAAEALQHAHDQGIMHLNVKPSNFLVRYHTDDVSRLYLQLMDFGVAKVTATSGMSQTVRGSLEYMAPEEWEGNPVLLLTSMRWQSWSTGF
jgi:eukaryotic-like serine/threonine-protein kinase